MAPFEGHVILRKRFGPLWFDVQDLITPQTYMMQQLMRRLGRRTVHSYWDWVIRHIAYPFGNPAWNDEHRQQAYWRPTWFGRAPRFVYRQMDYWEYPDEVLRDRVGDCKDSAALLTSMLRWVLSPRQVYMSVGWYHDHRHRHLHSWTTIFLPDGTPLALDTTYSRPLPAHQWVLEAPHYRPLWRANDQRTRILHPHEAQRTYGSDLRLQASAQVFTRSYTDSEAKGGVRYG